MVSLMEIFLSAIISDLTNRCIDFLASKRPNKLDAVEDRLQRVLLRAQVIVEEAMGRRITNQAMLRQLDALTNTVHRGYYALDTFRSCQQQQAEKEEPRLSGNGQTTTVSHWLSSHYFSRVDPCLSSRTSRVSKEMQEVLDTLSTMIVDAHELVLFLANYSRVYRQPYSMYLLLGNCMFGRQMEARYVIDFLLHTQPPGVAKEPEVLPIVGPCTVGKSTLVAHVCKDERVRDHFAEIVFLSNHDFEYDGLAAFREGLSAKNCTSSDHGTRRMLIVVEASGTEFDEDVWNRLYSASKHWMPMGSKIILTSRSVKVAKLGTTQALTLKHLSHEAYWYFFRTIVFGSADPTSSHPRFINLAMEIATVLNNGSMIIANVIARMMRDSFDAHFWGKLAAYLRFQFQKHVSRFGGDPYDHMNQEKPVYFRRMRSEQVICYHPYRHSSQKEVPKITLPEVTYGDAKLPAGRFQALASSSQIPPYYSYIYDCEIQELKSTGNKRKRSAKNGGAPSICL